MGRPTTTGSRRRSLPRVAQKARPEAKPPAGRRPAADAPEVEFVECATLPAVLKDLDRGGIDVCVLDGEAVPAGGARGHSRLASGVP